MITLNTYFYGIRNHLHIDRKKIVSATVLHSVYFVFRLHLLKLCYEGEMSSVNDQEPSGKLTQGHYTYQSPDDSDAKKGIAKVTTVTTSIGGKRTGPEITEITDEFKDSDSVDSNKVVKRSLTNGKFESIQKRFSQESFDQDSRRSSKEKNSYERTEESSRSTPRSSLVRGDSIKALQHKFQQATGN